MYPPGAYRPQRASAWLSFEIHAGRPSFAGGRHEFFEGHGSADRRVRHEPARRLDGHVRVVGLDLENATIVEFDFDHWGPPIMMGSGEGRGMLLQKRAKTCS